MGRGAGPALLCERYTSLVELFSNFPPQHGGVLSILRGFGIAIIALIVIVASLQLLLFSICAVGSGFKGMRASDLTIAAIALAVLIGGVYALKELNRRTTE